MPNPAKEAMTTPDAGLLPCPNPWCTAPRKHMGEAGPVHMKHDGWRVWCPCGVATPYQPTEAEAIAAWNTRAPVQSASPSGLVADGDVIYARGQYWAKWCGGTAAPDDWNGGRVLLASDEICHPYQSDEAFYWEHDVSETGCLEPGTIVGYISKRPRSAAAPAPADAANGEVVRLRGLIGEMLDNLKHCALDSNTCHCGEAMDKHSDPMSAGHTPVDMGWSAAESWIAKAEASLNPITEQEKSA